MFFCDENGEKFLCNVIKLFDLRLLFFVEIFVFFIDGWILNGFWLVFLSVVDFLIFLGVIFVFLLFKLLFCGNIFGMFVFSELCFWGFGIGVFCFLLVEFWFLIFLLVFGIVGMLEDCKDFSVLKMEVLVVFGDGGENGGVMIGLVMLDFLFDVMFFLLNVWLGFIEDGDNV